jgi:hypothetical protein
MRTKLDKWEAHFYSSLANCVLQMLLAAEVLGLSKAVRNICAGCSEI